jgi:hypothetical protein
MRRIATLAVALSFAVAPAAARAGTLLAAYSLSNPADPGHDDSGNGHDLGFDYANPDGSAGGISDGSHVISVSGEPFSSAFQFNGRAYLTNWFARASPVPFAEGAGAYETVTFWMNWSGGANEMPVSLIVYPWVDSLVYSGGHFSFSTGNGDTTGIADTGLANAWHFVEARFPAVVDAGTQSPPFGFQLFVDGVARALTYYGTTWQAPSAINPSGLVQISGADNGWSTTVDPFAGALADVRFYGDAAAAPAVPEPSLAWWLAGSILFFAIQASKRPFAFFRTPS